jgi:hypothetical protein
MAASNTNFEPRKGSKPTLRLEKTSKKVKIA